MSPAHYATHEAPHHPGWTAWRESAAYDGDRLYPLASGRPYPWWAYVLAWLTGRRLLRQRPDYARIGELEIALGLRSRTPDDGPPPPPRSARPDIRHR